MECDERSMKEFVPASYNIQNGCHNCINCFELNQYECNDKFYCTKICDKPIKLISDISSKELFTISDEEFYNICIVDDEFRDKSEVKSYGICDEWKPIE